MKDKRPTLRNSIGLVRLHILVLGTATIIAASTVLGLIWEGAAKAIGGQDPGQTWRNVINWGWAPVAVTVCSAAIRTAMALQTGVAMSMVASVLFEHHRVGLGDSAFFSIIRSVGVQPVGFLFSGGRGLIKSLGFMGFPLLVITALVSVASAFTSSILLFDFGNFRIVGNFSMTLVGTASPNLNTGTDIWRSAPAEFPRFAEYTDMTDRITTDQHVDDTGLTFRVPLPLAIKSNRETLRDYHGPATVFDRRVICIAPKEFIILNIVPAEDGISFGGYATFDSHLPLPLTGGKPDTNVTFNCIAPGIELDGQVSGVSNVTLCVTPSPTTPAGNPILGPLRIEPSFPFLNSTAYGPPVYFMIKGTPPNRMGGWTNFVVSQFKGLSPLNPSGFDVPPEALVATREGPWTVTKITGVQSLEGAEVAATACVMMPHGFTFNVTIRSETDGLEPALSWADTLNKLASSSTEELGASPMYNTKQILSQLNIMRADGNETSSLQQRGVMSLEFLKTDWTMPLQAKNFDDISQSMFKFFPSQLFPSSKILPKPSCDELGQIGHWTDPSAKMRDLNVGTAGHLTGHPVHVALFRDALDAAGGKPALALQGWMTTLTWQRYYDSLGWFTDKALARYAQSIEVFAPRQWKGFIAVMVIVGYHVLVVVALTLWFLVVNRYTMLGNSWQAVSQVVSEATSPLIEKVGSLNDSQVEKIIQQEMAGEATGHKFGIARNRKTGRVEVAREVGRHTKKLLA